MGEAARQQDQSESNRADEDWGPEEPRATPDIDSWPPAQRKAYFEEIGQLQARDAGSILVSDMLAKRGLSLSAYEKANGISKKVLSELINLKSVNGPFLATLFSVAAATDFDIELTLKDKRED